MLDVIEKNQIGDQGVGDVRYNAEFFPLLPSMLYSFCACNEANMVAVAAKKPINFFLLHFFQNKTNISFITPGLAYAMGKV